MTDPPVVTAWDRERAGHLLDSIPDVTVGRGGDGVVRMDVPGRGERAAPIVEALARARERGAREALERAAAEMALCEQKARDGAGEYYQGKEHAYEHAEDIIRSLPATPPEAQSSAED